MKKIIKIGILTFHRAHNYGAYLQSCALCNRLNQEPNIDCEIIDFRMRKEVDFYYQFRNRNRIKQFLMFRKTGFLEKRSVAFERAQCDPVMHLSPDALVSDSQEEFVEFVKDKYDVIIAGSDEIWKVDKLRGFPNPYWLPGNLGAVKTSYAASSRVKFEDLNSDQIQTMKNAWCDFGIISVRDHYTKELVDKVLGENKAFLSCDPSFVYDFQTPKRDVAEILAGRYKINNKKKNMLVMVTGRKLPLYILKNFYKDYNLINVFDYHPGFINVSDISPVEWLALIKNCDCVLTTYFHGTCFSLINNTPFVTFGSHRSSKIEGLFEGTSEEIQKHYVANTDEFITEASSKNKLAETFVRIRNMDDYLQHRKKEFPVYLELLKKTVSCNKL